jgi:hypothetical protein
MKPDFAQLITASVLLVLGAGAAQASVVAVSAAGGSEALLNVVNTTDGSSISLDLGIQIEGLSATSFALPQGVTSFITGAGGLAGVSFSVIAGRQANGTSAGTYLHSTDNDGVGSLANAVRGTWFSNLNNFVGLLNGTNPADTDTTVDATYGAFAAPDDGNYVKAGTDDWGTAAACSANDNVCNLVAGGGQARLFLVSFGTSPTGLAGVSDAIAGVGPVFASLDLGNSQLNIAAIPAPAAFWLGATAFGLLGLRARRRQT